jgi:hypothetical protein
VSEHVHVLVMRRDTCKKGLAMRRAYACIARARAATGAAACVQSVAACRRGLEGPRPSSAAPSHGRALSAGRAGAGAHRVTGTHSGPLQQRSWTGWQRTLRAAMWPASGARRGAAARRWRAPPSHATPGAWLLTGCISGSTEWGLVVSQEVFISAGTRFASSLRPVPKGPDRTCSFPTSTRWLVRCNPCWRPAWCSRCLPARTQVHGLR